VNEVFRNLVVDVPGPSAASATVSIVPIEGRFRFEEVAELVQNWKNLGAQGAFCANDNPPETATTSIDSTETGERAAYRWRVRLTNCDNRCLIVLGNILLGLGFEKQATAEGMSADKLWYKGIRIESPGELRERKRYEYREISGFGDKMYPGIARVIRPKVVFEGSDSPGSFREMRIEFQTGSAERRIELVAAAVDGWRRVVMAGYPYTIDDLYSGNCIIEGITVDLFDECTLEVKVETFGGRESAWNPLINLLGRIRNEIARITVF
jgi:hypothetical protein